MSWITFFASVYVSGAITLAFQSEGRIDWIGIMLWPLGVIQVLYRGE